MVARGGKIAKALIQIIFLTFKKTNNFILFFFSLVFMGAPSVVSERFTSGAHLKEGVLELAKYCGITKFSATLW